MIDALILAQHTYPEIFWRITYDEREHRNVLEGTDYARGVRISRFLASSPEATVESARRLLRICKPLGDQPAQLSLFAEVSP